MNFIEHINHTFKRHSQRSALCINSTYYTYAEFEKKVYEIKSMIDIKTRGQKQILGLLTNDDLETYASIIACWFSGCAFVPLSQAHPESRNRDILMQVEARYVLSSQSISFNGFEIIDTCEAIQQVNAISLVPVSDNDILCLLFTSGSTGQPKGVPMNLKNIDCTLEAFFSLGYNINEQDGFLQMFDFTFDMSMLSYLPAFITGACVYTVSPSKIRYLAALKVMHQYPVTFAAMVPSTLNFLRSYFHKIKLERLRYSILGGEAFHTNLALEWALCVPNARIVNISGPTEITMACMGYDVCTNRRTSIKEHKGILAFGKPWKNTSVLVVDDNNRPVDTGVEGELCFAGDHVMKGYWKMPEKNAQVFFVYDGQSYYKTGDKAFKDSDGDYYTCGRVDFQVKIQGHKVELEEIEYHVRIITKHTACVAMGLNNHLNQMQIILFIEDSMISDEEIIISLRSKLPAYMIPQHICRLKTFPVNQNGKIDRLVLRKIFENGRTI